MTPALADHLEELAEREAIMEYDGGMTREQAKQAAAERMTEKYGGRDEPAAEQEQLGLF